MRQLGILANEADARRLADYLLTSGISCRVDPAGEAWAVWVRNEDQLEAASRELAAFRADPLAERYAAASAQARVIRREEERRESQARKNIVDVSRTWDGRQVGRTPLTWILIVASVWVSVQTHFGKDQSGLLEKLYYIRIRIMNGDRLTPVVDDVRSGEAWRLVTPIFLHLTVLHLLFNMLWMYDLGRRIESLIGMWRYGLMILLFAVTSNFGQYWFVGPGFGGMSGVVYGLFGYAWMRGHYLGCAALYMGPNAAFIMIGWFVLCATGKVGLVANWAHGVGLAAGVLIGIAPLALRRRP